jgi:hypothetical protein
MSMVCFSSCAAKQSRAKAVQASKRTGTPRVWRVGVPAVGVLMPRDSTPRLYRIMQCIMISPRPLPRTLAIYDDPVTVNGGWGCKAKRSVDYNCRKKVSPYHRLHWALSFTSFFLSITCTHALVGFYGPCVTNSRYCGAPTTKRYSTLFFFGTAIA